MRRDPRRLRRRGRRSGTAAPTRYRTRERLVSVDDDVDVADADGNRAFRVDAEALRVRVRDTYGVEVGPAVDHAIVIAVVTAIDAI
ncbi:hypothetical protein [Halobaculum lipolyticum]|uniref:Uncharacterized protein n=1 Tax=Halobaculum lipolyticum TaxID=3032001 RepID=A0ABD5WB78_9EURY|nr:hypothetical protein [Halobaculum sp. DT31]